MKTSLNLKLIIFVSLIIAAGFSCRGQSDDGWKPDTYRLDRGPVDTNFVTLARDVKEFYELLHKKDWKATYDRRWKYFRQDVQEKDYLEEGRTEGKHWGLVNYEILALHLYTSSNHDCDQAVMICKFVELPDKAISYANVRWRKEDGIWKCDTAGPVKLSIFEYLRREPCDQ